MKYWIGGPEMLYEKTTDVIYELSCFSINMLMINKRKDVITEIQSTVKRLSGLFDDLSLRPR